MNYRGLGTVPQRTQRPMAVGIPHWGSTDIISYNKLTIKYNVQYFKERSVKILITIQHSQSSERFYQFR